MRFLGWGIGHLNPADFPHEADALVASDEDRLLASVSQAETSVLSVQGAEDDLRSADEDESTSEDDDSAGDDEVEEGCESVIEQYEY